MNDDASAAVQRRMDDLDEQMRGMFARTLAQGSVVQALLSVALSLPEAIKTPLLRVLREPPSPGDKPLSDLAAAWWSDVEVLRQQALETMIERAEAEVRRSQGQEPGERDG